MGHESAPHSSKAVRLTHKFLLSRLASDAGVKNSYWRLRCPIH
nr:MAG TPA: hypothetical protein [Caudoviricetes sp.]